MGRSPGPLLAGPLAGLLLASAAAVQAPGGVSVGLRLSAREATVGDPLELVLTVDVPEGTRLVPPELGREIGPFTVLSESWDAPLSQDGSIRHVWRAAVAAYRTGELVFPPLTVRVEPTEGEGEARTARTEPVEITIRSVLPPEEAELELADLKGPASIAPDYRALWTAGGILLVLLLLSALAWWLHRRYADRLAAKPVPRDPFHRIPPHVWVYGELQRLLERRLAEEGRIELFYAELAWILKRYLGGRYRVELMERTTAEVPGLLGQVGAPAEPSLAARTFLERCDQVKFAREVPAPDVCRGEIEEAYRIVDATKPSTEAGPASVKGAA